MFVHFEWHTKAVAAATALQSVPRLTATTQFLEDALEWNGLAPLTLRDRFEEHFFRLLVDLERFVALR
jgi:hypothetical protein